ncbi:MAG: c-type cytochrome [Pseudomonadota bacterium]
MKLKMLRYAVAAAVGVMLSTQPASADEALAQAKGCMACHSVDNKLVGPAFKDVAAKYKGTDGAAGTLAGKIKSGSSGTWGEVPMPPQSALSDDETAALAAWVLSL